MSVEIVALQDQKIMNRLSYFRNFLNTFTTISGGTVVAVLAYMSSRGTDKSYFVVAFVGITMMIVTIFLNIVQMYLAYFLVGHLMYDNLRKANRLTDKYIRPMTTISILTTLVGYITLLIFLVKTI